MKSKIFVLMVVLLCKGAYSQTAQPEIKGRIGDERAPIDFKPPGPRTLPPEKIIIDPIMVRINNETKALAQKVFPAVAKQSGLLHHDFGKIDVDDYDKTEYVVSPLDGKRVIVDGKPIEIYRLRVQTWVEDLRVRAPIEANDLSAHFKTAAVGKGRLDSAFDFDKATLSLKFRVKVSVRSGLVPKEITDLFTQRDNFTITVTGFKGHLDVTADKTTTGLAVEPVDAGAFSLQVKRITVGDSGPLTEIADFLLGFDKLFNVIGASNANQAATKLVNKLLGTKGDASKQIRNAVSGALAGVSAPQFAKQTLPLTGGATMNAAATFASFRTQSDSAMSEWSVDLTGAPGGKVPSLSYHSINRPFGDPAFLDDPRTAPHQGDVQAFIPYSLIDKGLFEVIQTGLISKIAVPPGALVGVSGFTIELTPTEVPRAKADPNNPDTLVIEFAASMKDKAVPGLQMAPVDKIAQAVVKVAEPLGKIVDSAGRIPEAGTIVSTLIPDIQIENGAGKVKLSCQIKADDRSGIYIQVTSVVLDQLAGSLVVGPKRTDLSGYKKDFEKLILSQFDKGLPKLTLMSRTVNLVTPLKAQIGSPMLGARYIQIPLTIQ